MYVTTDSAPGWVPSVAQEAMAERAARAFLTAADEGRFDDAYAAFSDLYKQSSPREEFIRNEQAFHTEAGTALWHRFTRTTWTKDPANAPMPGIYAAIDVTSRFERMDRHCGYVVLFQASSDDAFTVMRQEQNYMSNSTAAEIERTRSRADMEGVWRQVSSHCPNYSGLEE